MTSEAGRAAAAVAALIVLAVAAAALLVSSPARLQSAPRPAVARFCPLPAAAPGLDPAASLAGLATGLLAAGAAFALVRLAGTLRRTRRIEASLGPAASARVSSRAAARVGARTARLGLPIAPLVADLDGRPAAFTIGLLRPRVVVSTAVVEALADAELDALLLHEAAHARRRDPLRLTVAGFCRDLLFFLPASRALFRLALEAQERAADDAAAETVGPVEVAGALVALLKLAGRRPAVGPAPAATGGDPEARVRRLLGLPKASRPGRASLPRAGAGALVSAALFAALAWMPVRAPDLLPAGGCCAARVTSPGPAGYC